MAARAAVAHALRRCSSHAAVEPLTLASHSPCIRSLAGPSRRPPEAGKLSRDFLFWPAFFDEDESRELLRMALWKLDRADTTRRRRNRMRTAADDAPSQGRSRAQLQDLFEGEYGFEEGHYDSVIHDYRETLLSSLPPSPSSSLTGLLSRLYSLLPDTSLSAADALPPPRTTTHLLHLSPKGAILPHVDNLEASGSVILGLSLGAERTMRLKVKGEGQDGWELRLPSGSVYLQRDAIRYQYEHSILPYGDEGSKWDGQPLEAGHRVSVMIRDAPARAAAL